jgi:hypothetical protein
MTQTSHTNLVSLVLASRGLAPTRAFTPEHANDYASASDESLFASAEIVVRVFAIAALLVAAVASYNGDHSVQADGPTADIEAQV